MTNLERLRDLPAREFWDEITRAKNSLYSEYIDYVAWLENEDEELRNFVKAIGECSVKPSEIEILQCANKVDGIITDAARSIYIATHTKKAQILAISNIFGDPYYTVAYMDSVHSIVKVPVENTTDVQFYKENYN